MGSEEVGDGWKLLFVVNVVVQLPELSAFVAKLGDELSWR